MKNNDGLTIKNPGLSLLKVQELITKPTQQQL
jgi:hypothetical protein